MAVRLNITMDDDVYARLKKEVPPKNSVPLFAKRSDPNFTLLRKRWTLPIGQPGKKGGENSWRMIGGALMVRGGLSEEDASTGGCLLGGSGSNAGFGTQEIQAGNDCLQQFL